MRVAWLSLVGVGHRRSWGGGVAGKPRWEYGARCCYGPWEDHGPLWRCWEYQRAVKSGEDEWSGRPCWVDGARPGHRLQKVASRSRSRKVVSSPCSRRPRRGSKCMETSRCRDFKDAQRAQAAWGCCSLADACSNGTVVHKTKVVRVGLRLLSSVAVQGQVVAVLADSSSA